MTMRTARRIWIWCCMNRRVLFSERWREKILIGPGPNGRHRGRGKQARHGGSRAVRGRGRGLAVREIEAAVSCAIEQGATRALLGRGREKRELQRELQRVAGT